MKKVDTTYLCDVCGSPMPYGNTTEQDQYIAKLSEIVFNVDGKRLEFTFGIEEVNRFGYATDPAIVRTPLHDLCRSCRCKLFASAAIEYVAKWTPGAVSAAKRSAGGDTTP